MNEQLQRTRSEISRADRHAKQKADQANVAGADAPTRSNDTLPAATIEPPKTAGAHHEEPLDPYAQ